MTNHIAAAERLADLANRLSFGDASGTLEAHAAAGALATEGVVHALLALTYELRDLRGDLNIDRPPLVIYRAALEGVSLGLYTNRDAARDHCTAEARDAGHAALAWFTEADSDEDELHAGDDGRTGFTVEPVDVDDEFDADAEA